MRTSYANVASTLALVLALGGGGAYAAQKVTGKDIKNSSVTGKDVKDGGLSGSDVQDGSLVGTDVRPGSLGADRLSAQVNAAIAATPPDHATPVNATVPVKFRDVPQTIGQVAGLTLTIGCGTYTQGTNIRGVDLSLSMASGESYSDLGLWGAPSAAQDQSSVRRTALGGSLVLASADLSGGTKVTGAGTFVVVGGPVPLSGQVALSYDDTAQSCRVSGWILHG